MNADHVNADGPHFASPQFASPVAFNLSQLASRHGNTNWFCSFPLDS